MSQPQRIFTRNEPIYSLALQPEDPYIVAQLSDAIYQCVGQTQEGRELAKQIGADEVIKFESINKPMTTGLLFEGDEYRPQQRVIVSCRFELIVSDSELPYLRCALRGVDAAPEFEFYQEQDTSPTAAELKYGELVF